MDKQKGALVIEAAYVLPLIMAAALLLVDTAIYATDRLSTNNAVNDVYQLVVSQSQFLSLNPGKGSSTQYVTCQNNKVEPEKGKLTSLVKDAVASVVTRQPDDIRVQVTEPATDITDYIVEIEFDSHTLFLPDSLAQTFPVRSRMYISFDYSC